MNRNTKRIGLLLLVALAGCTTDEGAQPTATNEPESTPTATTAAISTATVEVDSPWEVVLHIEVAQALRMASFFDESNGVTVAPQAYPAYYTRDGGETWLESEGIDRCNYGLDFVDERVVWECNKDTLMVSEDGGQSWSEKGPGDHGCRISFADAETGWVLASSRLRLTVDGGDSWEAASLPVARVDVNAVSLRTAQAGYLMTKDGSMYATDDRGESWSVVPLDLGRYDGAVLAHFNMPDRLPAAAIRFLDADNGVVIMNLTDGRNTVVVAARTADGGQTWSDEKVLVGTGVPYLTRDGMLLTLYEFLDSSITVLAYEGD